MTRDFNDSVDSSERELDSAQEVYAPADQPFEAPAKKFVDGPFYADADELMPDLVDELDPPTKMKIESKVKPSTQDEPELPVDRRDFIIFA